MNVTGRINRILFILSYVSQNQGILVEDLARRVGMRPRQLLKELEFISLIGKPPFKPDDYIDIYVENQQVLIELDQSLNRPIRFTRPEAVALLMSLELLDAEVDPDGVGSLKGKIGRAISSSVDQSNQLENRIVLERDTHLIGDRFSLIRSAIENRETLEIEYFSLMRNETTKRRVRPYFLMKKLGYWYLTGYCELRDDLRTFKFERILSAKSLGEVFTDPEGFDLGRYKADFDLSSGERKIEIFFDRQLAPWIREQWGASVRNAEDEGVILTVYSETLEFPSRLVLRSVPYARPLSPPEFVEKLRRDAEDIISLQGLEA